MGCIVAVEMETVFGTGCTAAVVDIVVAAAVVDIGAAVAVDS